MPALTVLWRRFRWPLLAGLLLTLAALALYVVADEVQTSRMQAARLSKLASELRFKVEPGPSSAIRFPGHGPYDERFGYRQLPSFVERLTVQDYAVTAQARMSPRLIELSDRGLFATYREKNQAGLELRDCRGEPLFVARFPERVYERFESVPQLLVDALLFIENRELLDPQRPTANPAFEWDRLARAAGDHALRLLDRTHPAAGGSTLPTQIEKYRHSPGGRTESVREKLRQMTSASLRAYLDGEYTLPRRRQIVVDYLNTVPLAAKAGYGEVNGLGDGLSAWYGRDFTEVNRLLEGSGNGVPSDDRLARQALAFKQALALMVAQRRPSYYFSDGGEASLSELTNSYLRVLAEAGVIGPALRDAALPVRLDLQGESAVERSVSFVDRKAATAVRGRLSSLLSVPRLYDLDRLDLAADTTTHGDVQRAVAQALRSLAEPAAAKAAGLYGSRMLNARDDSSKLVFSFTLFERGERSNLLRVQTDNYDQPLDINEGAKLDLGSTAKLRTLITYLEVIAELHGRWSGLDGINLAALGVSRRYALGRWARDYLLRAEDKSLAAMLEAAMQRSYSASPAESFFTGGGVHRFENFDPKHNRRALSVREALEHSVNLVFIRLMRDVVQHFMLDEAGFVDETEPSRQDHLARFADHEGREFIARFYRKYQGKSRDEAQELLLQSVRASAASLASVYGTLEPNAGADRLAAFLARRLGKVGLSEQTLRVLHEKHGPGRLSLADRGYLAGVHPLELWLVAYLREHRGATLGDAFDASRDERQQVYGWLFKSSNRSAQDLRIHSLLEQKAFVEIQHAWARLGYPFAALTPSYATAIGASGDRPAALAELIGIIVNRGMRLPVERIGSLAFARDTPYETRLGYQPPQAERVVPMEVADIVRRSLIGVVQSGTARRLKGAFVARDGGVFEVGGKTGTGDHRFDVHDRQGRLISSRAVNRSATFVFLIGEHHFGTLMVYVPEPDASKYKFTSAMPVQLLKSLAPVLLPLLEPGVCHAADRPSG